MVLTFASRSWRGARDMLQLFHLQTYVRLKNTSQKINLFSTDSTRREDSVRNISQGAAQGIIKDDFEKVRRMVSRNEEHYLPSDTLRDIPKTRNILPYIDKGHTPRFFTILTYGSLDFTSHKTFPIQKTSLLRKRTPLLLVLLSTSHTNLLKNTDAFISPLIQRCFKGYMAEQAIDVLCAVVDLVAHRPVSRQSFFGTDVHTKIQGIGGQGISVLVMDSESAVPDLWSTQEQDRQAETVEEPEAASLIFRFQPSSQSRASLAGADPLGSRYISHTVQLHLANTVFQNGQRSTMLAERWLLSKDPLDKPLLHRTWAKRLSHQVVDMAEVDRNRYHRLRPYSEHISIITKLRPITPPRVVDAAIGNILRRLRTSNHDEGSMPASQELEEAIAAFNARTGTTPQAVSVWASVTPCENWITQPHVPNVRVVHTLGSGTRFHKVMGGGGGWGIKQGLLALDPDYKLQVPENEQDTSSKNELGTQEDNIEALEQIVKPGDVVVFSIYTAPNKNIFQADRPRSPSQSFQISGPPLIALGSMSSSAAEMGPVASSKVDGKTDAGGNSGHIFIPGFFGALTERGIRLKMSLHSPSGALEIGAQRTGTIVETKLDVPGSIFAHGHYKPVALSQTRDVTQM